MSTSGDADRLASVKEPAVSLRTVIEATRRLDELGTARWIEIAAEVVHKAQGQGQALGKLTPESLVMRHGKLVLELPQLAAYRYTAPERLRGSSGDRRSDVWSLGVLVPEAIIVRAGEVTLALPATPAIAYPNGTCSPGGSLAYCAPERV
ncbi:MAG: hypothetical protein H0V17_30700, partial [Deltaproteobacteria bacterium]|nr:hypothetical protein [Deltaproteobacteria bacterium]